VPVPDEQLPGDLALTAALQPLLGTSEKAGTLLGWVETEPEKALMASVRWHLANPPADASDDFGPDDLALRAADR